MYHIITGRPTWCYDKDKSGYWIHLDYGATKQARGFILVERGIQKTPSESNEFHTPYYTLMEGEFSVATQDDKEGIVILNKADDTNRLLLMVGHEQGYRGFIRIVGAATTAQVIKSVSAHNRIDGAVAAVILMEPDTRAVFMSTGRYGTTYHVHRWDGTKHEHLSLNEAEWTARGANLKSVTVL